MKVAVCLNGTEDIIADDLKGKKLADGRVAFSKGKNISGVSAVYSLIEQIKFKEYKDLIEKISKIKFDFKGSFRVDCNRMGEHDFDSSTIEREAGEIIYNKGFKVDLKEHENRVYLDVIDQYCFVGMLEKDKMCKRDYRVRVSNQGLNACLAYCIARLLGKGDLIDPYCRDGIIAIEAAKLKLGKVYAWDENENNLRNSKTNAELADVKINFSKKDNLNVATFLPVVSKNNKSNEWKIKDFFDKFKAKKMILCTLNKDLVKKYCKKKLISEREIKIGDFKYSLLEY